MTPPTVARGGDREGAHTIHKPGERVVARDPSIARSWVGRTICACFPCMVAPQSARSLYSYANSHSEGQCYQSAIVSSQILSQTRPTTGLHRKAFFVQQLRHDAGITDVDH